MPKWEYKFVRIWKENILAIDDLELGDHPLDWRKWLKEVGLHGWELVAMVSFTGYSVHATLKRQIPE